MVSFCLRTSQEEHVLSLLHRLVTLVEQSHRERADATIGILVGMFVFHNNPSVNGVTDEDRSQEFAAQLKHREDCALKNSDPVDQAQIHVVNEGAMRDAGLERAEVTRKFFVDMQGVEVAREPRESEDIVFGNGATSGPEFLPDGEVVPGLSRVSFRHFY
jgi:hypothetical protein